MIDQVAMDEGRSISPARRFAPDNGNIPAAGSGSVLERRRDGDRIGRRIGRRIIAMRDVSILGVGSTRIGRHGETAIDDPAADAAPAS